MIVEIDQSGRLEQLNTDTVLAFANGESAAVVIKVSVKRSLIIKLKRSVVPHDELMPLLFAVCIFLLVRELPKQVILEIDEEYTGKNKYIANALKKMLGEKWIGEIRFKRIGKKSAAHKLAWSCHRSPEKKRRLTRLSFDEIMSYFVGN